MDQDPSHLRERITRHGLRGTRQRCLLYGALCQTRHHPTAEELFQSVRADEPALSLATVYNTLEAFTRVGLCRKIACAHGSGACRYDADMTRHVHLVTGDGRVLDLPDDLSERILSRLPPDLAREISRRLNVPAEQVSVQLVSSVVRPPAGGVPDDPDDGDSPL